MEARNSIRIPVYIEADFYLEGESYAGFIGNLSESGAYVEISHAQGEKDFSPGEMLNMEFRHPSGAPLYLNCQVAWTHAKLVDDESLITGMGMKLVDPPISYKELISSEYQSPYL